VSTPTAAFFFDLGDPHCYLAAERILHELPVAAEWRPVLGRDLGPEAHSAFRCEQDRDIYMEEVDRRGRELGLQPLRWPDPFPFDSALAMQVATYARSIGRTVAFAQAAFRQAFAGGRSLEDEDSVVIAAAACEMHPAAVLGAAGRSSVAARLGQETRAAAAAGVDELPAIALEGSILAGPRALDDALARLRGGGRGGAAA
jgi:2-hydroxychromene-2-carboxylate isomerase